jgi:hypothetical protein
MTAPQEKSWGCFLYSLDQRYILSIMSSEKNSDIIQTSRRFFGYALRHTPEELFERSNKPKPYQLGSHVASYLIHKAQDDELFSHQELRHMRLLFSAALDDTRTILMREMYERSMPIELIPLIARDERTVVSIARLALHNEGIMRTMLSTTANQDYFNLSDGMTHVQVTDKLIDSASGGCPFAASPERTLPPDPLFRRTIHLAGDLTYLVHKK